MEVMEDPAGVTSNEDQGGTVVVRCAGNVSLVDIVCSLDNDLGQFRGTKVR